MDPFQNDSLTLRRKQLLDVLETLGDPSYSALVCEMLEKLDFERGFFILQNGMVHLQASGFWDEVWAVFEAKHGRLADFVRPTLEEILRRDALVGLRSCVVEVEHRFFLALILNNLDRKDLLRFVEQRYGGDPAETVARWQAELEECYEDAAWVLQGAASILN